MWMRFDTGAIFFDRQIFDEDKLHVEITAGNFYRQLSVHRYLPDIDNF